MSFFGPALRLLQVIEQGNYEEALSITNDCNLETEGRLALVAQDLIYKVAYSFGNENNSCLKLLLIRLFDLLTSVPEKFRICYELLVWRTSPLLTDVLVNQLGLLITEDFVLCHPELWEQVCEDLPIKLERRLCERLASSEEDLWYAIVESAHVLAFFDKIPFRIPYKFGKLVDGVLNETASDEAAAYPFLVWYAREHPFSPKLCHTEPTVLIPNVYDLRFLQLRLVEGVCEYIKSSNYNCAGTIVKPLVNAMKFLHNLCYDCRELYARHIDIYAEMFVRLLRFMDDFDMEPHKYVIIEKSQDILLCFPLELRVLLIRNVIARIVNETHLFLECESKVLAWLLDQLNQDLCEKICAGELGSIFGLLEHVTYDDVPASTDYYSSILRIVKAFAFQSVNLPMLAETRERIIVRIRDEILDYLQGKLLNGETRHLAIDGLNNDVHPPCDAESDEQSIIQLYKIVEDCEQTMTDIDSILSRRSEVH